MSLNIFMKIVVREVVLALRYGVKVSAARRAKLEYDRIMYFSFSFLLSNDIRIENVV